MDISTFVVQFIRVLSLQCKHIGVGWQLIGAYVCAMIAGNTNFDDTVDIVITPSRNGISAAHGIDRLMYELQVLGYICKTSIAKPNMPREATVSMALGTESKTFTVLFHCGPLQHDGVLESTSLLQFNSDFLCINSNGLGVVERNSITDHMNPCAGVAMLERISELRAKKTRMVGKYVFNMPMPVIRQHNAMLLRRQEQMEDAGITVIGGGADLRTAQADETCPVCMEASGRFVTLECGHAFCVTCLAKHMEEKSSPNSRHLCMMCRAPIVMRLRA
jgi:Zinc finger, C3HC4 type (RING finger)